MEPTLKAAVKHYDAAMSQPKRFLAADRQRRILERVAKVGSADLQSLADDLGVSVMTIRRDVKELASRGQLNITRGGATVMIGQDQEILTNPRALSQVVEKAAIGQCAAEMVAPGDVIFIGTGSTTAQFVQFLDPGMNITVITPSLPHATVLAARGVSVISTGGIVQGSDLAQSGPQALEMIARHHPRFAFIGAQGVSLEAGLTETEATIADLNRAAVGHAGSVILLADSTKIGRTCAFRVSELAEVATLVTTPEGAAAAADHGLDAICKIQTA